MAKKMGRPKKKFDFNLFEMLCSLQCTEEEIAFHMKVSVDTLGRRVKEYYDQTFAETYKVKRLGGILSIRRKIFSTAMQGDKTLLIWLDKKYAHLQGDVDQRVYGGDAYGAARGDQKIDINVSFTDKPAECIAEVAEIEKLKDEESKT